MTIALQKGLVLHMPLDQESLQSATVFADKTPYENVGTSANVPVFVADRMGQADRAMSFNGTTDYITHNLISFNDAVPHTYAAWVKWNGGVVTNHVIPFGDTAGTWAIYLSNVTTKVLYYRTASGTRVVSGTNTTALFDGNWHLVSWTVDSGRTVTVYIDGGFNGASILSETDMKYSGIGRGYTGNAYLWNGSLADIRIYNRAITPAEITALYEAYRPKLSLGSLMKGLVLDMPLQSRYMKSATVLTDRTPHSNDGVNSGATVGADYTTFNGTSDNIRIADSESLSPTSAMTAVCWVKGAASNHSILTKYEVATANRSYALSCGGYAPFNKFRAVISSDGLFTANYKVYESSIITFDSNWHLIGFSFDAGTLKLYSDGVEDVNLTKYVDHAITTIHNSTADVMVGCYLSSDTPTSFFAGDIAKARIYNRALTPSEWLLAFEKERSYRR